MQASELTSAAYWAEIASLAEAIWEAATAGEDSRDAAHDLIDSHQFVIYTGLACKVLSISPSDDALFEELGPDAIVGVDSMVQIYTRGAYFAMMADVFDHDLEDLEPGRFYLNPNDCGPTRLPSLEVFEASEDAVEASRKIAEAGLGEQNLPEPGFYFWTCMPGCLPDSEPMGPYDTVRDAVAAAREDLV